MEESRSSSRSRVTLRLPGFDPRVISDGADVTRRSHCRHRPITPMGTGLKRSRARGSSQRLLGAPPIPQDSLARVEHSPLFSLPRSPFSLSSYPRSDESPHLARPRRRPRRHPSRPRNPGAHRRRDQGHVHGHLRLRPPPVRRLCADDERGRHHRPRADGHRRGSGLRRDAPQKGRPRRGAVHHLVRDVLVLRADDVLALRHHEPQARERARADGPLAGRRLRLLAPAGRHSGRAGRVPPRPPRRRGPDRGAGRHDGRAGALSLRHLPDGLHGGRERRDRARRHRGRVGLRTGGPVRHPERVDARRRPRDRARPRAGAPTHGGRALERPRS